MTPQYNRGYPASLKNALDYLFKKWNGQPAGSIAYGGHGGNKCAVQLHQVLTGLRMHVHAPPALITLMREHQLCGITLEVAWRDIECYTPEVIRVADSLEQELYPSVQSQCN